MTDLGQLASWDRIAKLEAKVARLCVQWRDSYMENKTLRAKVERLQAALESLLEDPPPTLDEPDMDAEVIVKMRAIARAALSDKP